jgi:hypothetical protein
MHLLTITEDRSDGQTDIATPERTVGEACDLLVGGRGLAG